MTLFVVLKTPAEFAVPTMEIKDPGSGTFPAYTLRVTVAVVPTELSAIT
jgi:hypothetical protein